MRRRNVTWLLTAYDPCPQYLVRASFLEIYNEDVRDLLAKNSQNRLEVKENPDSGVYVKDLTGFVVNSVAELNNVLAVGKKNRSVGATLMNQVRCSNQLAAYLTLRLRPRFRCGCGAIVVFLDAW